MWLLYAERSERWERNWAEDLSIALGLYCVWVSGCSDKYVDRLIDRTSRSAERKVEQRINQRIDQQINKAITKSENSVVCVATDPDCMTKAKAKEVGKKVVLMGEEDAPDLVKCAATDQACLSEAKQAGKKVRIVEDGVLRCKATDAGCLRRSQTSGQPVEIID